MRWPACSLCSCARKLNWSRAPLKSTSSCTDRWNSAHCGHSRKSKSPHKTRFWTFDHWWIPEASRGICLAGPRIRSLPSWSWPFSCPTKTVSFLVLCQWLASITTASVIVAVGRLLSHLGPCSALDTCFGAYCRQPPSCVFSKYCPF